jgi:hypothetical protein
MTDATLIQAAYNLCNALDLPSDAPASTSARLKELAKGGEEMTELVVAFTECEGIVMGEKEAARAAWRSPALKTAAERWQAVCDSFPSLRSNTLASVAISEAKLRDLEQVARRSDVGEGCKHAIRFMLSMWNPGFQWECGKFEIVPALKAWDATHRAAFNAWCADPWWP